MKPNYKKLLLSLMALVLLSLSKPVQGNAYLGKYYWKQAIIMESCDISGNGNGELILSKAGQSFTCIHVMDSVAIIKIDEYIISNWKKDAKQKANQENVKTFNQKNGTDIYFLIDTAKLSLAEKFWVVPRSVSIGVLNLPFKARLLKDNFDFAGNFNLGTTVSLNFKHLSYKKGTPAILAGFSYGNTILDSSSVTRNHSDLVSSNNFSTLSGCIGFSYGYDRMMFGAVFGIDYLNRVNQNHYDWAYQGKPWFSLMIGIQLAPLNTSQSKKETSNP